MFRQKKQFSTSHNWSTNLGAVMKTEQRSIMLWKKDKKMPVLVFHLPLA